MSVVAVYINGKEHQLACDSGEEEQLVLLSQEIDDRVQQLSRQVPHATESLLLLLVSIMLADELADTKRNVKQLQKQINELQSMMRKEGDTGDSDQKEKIIAMEKAMASTLEDVAKRIEKIAQQLDIQ